MAPHASVLPQLTAIALGIVLLRKALNRKPPETAAPDEAADAEPAAPKTSQPMAILSRFAFLDSLETPLGLAALVLGVLHLVAGGFGLL